MRNNYKWFIYGGVAGSVITGLLSLHLGLSFVRASHMQGVAAEINLANVAVQATDLASAQQAQLRFATCSLAYFASLESSLYYFQSDKNDLARLQSSLRSADKAQCSG
ncbi:hypothetical protein [Rheinheimera sp.]|uniref:hypothetical protein n=1 Tax=Rheinheimera sp. TaxID=1869214 RepID=UPI00307D6760